MVDSLPEMRCRIPGFYVVLIKRMQSIRSLGVAVTKFSPTALVSPHILTYPGGTF